MSVISQGRVAAFSNLSSLQFQVDQLVGSFADTATDGRSLAAMTAGGLAYRAGRLGVLGLGSGSVLRAVSVGLGLTAEVSTFEFTHRALSSQTPNLWRWNGNDGLRQGLIQSFIAFGTLKGAGRLAQGENVMAQHLLQDSAMVLGHQVSGALGLSPRPTGTLAEQFLHAEATNLQIGAGMALAHCLAPGVHGLERAFASVPDLTNPALLRAEEMRPAIPALAAAAGTGSTNAGGSVFQEALVYMAAKEGPPRKGNPEEVPSPNSRKVPLPMVERFSRSTEVSPMDLSAPVHKVYEIIEGLLRGTSVPPLVLLMEGEGDAARIASRFKVYLAERHAKKLIPQEFALALLFPGREKGLVIYPHGLEIRSEEATSELLRRVRGIEKGLSSNSPSVPKPKADGLFHYRGRPYRIEGVPSDAEFKEASENSSDPLTELLDTVGSHLRNSATKSLVFSFGVNHADPLEVRVRLSRLLREKNLPPGPVIVVSLVNDAEAFLFQRKGLSVQVDPSRIQMVDPNSEKNPESGESPPKRKLPSAETVPELFELLKTELQKKKPVEIIFTGRTWNPKTQGPALSRWLEFPSHALPQGEVITIHMPNLQDKKGPSEKTVIFLWQGKQIGLAEEPLGIAEIKR